MHNTSYYCSKKFTYLKVDLEKGTTYNCDAADPQQIDMQTIRDRPGLLFNSNFMIKEREMMLANVRTSTCEESCWKYEEQDLVSPRINHKTYIKTHTNTFCTPDTLEIVMNSECSLSCIYCCKEFSSSWKNDLMKNGPYPLIYPERYKLNLKDNILAKLSHEQGKSRQSLLFDEIKSYLPGIKLLRFTGGEPLLDKRLFDFFQYLDPETEVEVVTGLGIKKKHLLKILDALKKHNVKFAISAETTADLYDFVRHGNKWEEFLTKVDIIKEKGFTIQFNVTLCNISVLGFADFYKQFPNDLFSHRLLSHPNFLAPYVLDDTSKQHIATTLSNINDPNVTDIINALNTIPTEQQRQECNTFIHEFAGRRAIDLSFLPKSFIEWLKK